MARSLAALLLAFLPLARCACSPAENVCGDMCCCVTCKCLDSPPSCEDMWGKPTDPVGYVHDERWSDPTWLENHHREQMAIAEQHRQEHVERMREMEANMSPEEKDRRERMSRRRMEKRRKRGFEGMPDLDGAPPDFDDFDEDADNEEEGWEKEMRGMGAPDDGVPDVAKMRRRMEKRMNDAMRKHRRRAQPEDGEAGGEVPAGGYGKGWSEHNAESDPALHPEL